MSPPPSTHFVAPIFEAPAIARGGFAAPAKFWSKLIACSGPGYLIAVGYMDPGNWATDIAGGAKFGFALLPVIVFSNFAAMFLQRLALRLGMVTGLDLAQHCRARFSPWVARLLWFTAEIAIIACDLAEVLGTAIALNLLFRLPLVWGVAITAFDTLLIMGLQKSGMRALQSIVIGLIGVIAACFIYEMIACHPGAGALLGSFVPSSRTPTSSLALYISLGIFGATVMPHNLYLHSAIARRQHSGGTAATLQNVRFATFDCFSALAVAVLINAAILITAASAFHWSGHSGVVTIDEAYKLLAPALGAGAASAVFAIALLAAGQNSTLTGTMAGQVVMEGFLGLKMKPSLQRILTRGIAILPALAVTALAGSSGSARLLIFSQVVLSLQLGFAVIPLIAFTSDPKLMGDFASGTWGRRSGYALATAIIAANCWLIMQMMI